MSIFVRKLFFLNLVLCLCSLKVYYFDIVLLEPYLVEKITIMFRKIFE